MWLDKLQVLDMSCPGSVLRCRKITGLFTADVAKTNPVSQLNISSPVPLEEYKFVLAASGKLIQTCLTFCFFSTVAAAAGTLLSPIIKLFSRILTLL